MVDHTRLIERAFPLKQASLDSVHEKNVRHGHISTLHIWPARRPLAAARAALIATLLPDPGTPEERRKLCEKIGGKIIQKVEKKRMPGGRAVDRIKEETDGGILHWKRETENAETLQWFRNEIRKVYGGRAPRVLDPFAGGGAIPFEAMRLGCEVTAVDINPVAWFILKCTLEYPQKLAGQTRPLPDFILDDEQFMEAFHRAHPHLVGRTKRTKKPDEALQDDMFRTNTPDYGHPPEADLAWQVRAWGRWVLHRARRELSRFYPLYADFEALAPGKAFEKQSMHVMPLGEDGTPGNDELNADFTEEYLADKRNPRWVAKPTVAYLWARTVTCKNCRATVPLLKTRWLCKKARKRVLLTMKPNADKSGVVFGIEEDPPLKGGNAAQRREHDKRIGGGTMSRAGAKCPCCSAIMMMEDIRLEGRAYRLGSVLTAIVVDGPKGKEYRLPTSHELDLAMPGEEDILAAFRDVPFGIPDEPLPSTEALGMRIPLYGFGKWQELFTPRQLLMLGTFGEATRAARDAMKAGQVPSDWIEALGAYLALSHDKLADRSSTQCIWISTNAEKASGSFGRFALPITWDYAEIMPWSQSAGGYIGNLDHIAEFVEHALGAATGAEARTVCASAVRAGDTAAYDAIVTDPPYYDAIPYSDLMDFFYVWLRRTLNGLSDATSATFSNPLAPKWDHDANDGELVDDVSRHDNDAAKSRKTYEDGMARAFEACSTSLRPDGRLVIVFAHKNPDAWETLVAAIIRAGFTVDGSWPIQTERTGRIRAQTSAALASSVWLVCKKRLATAGPGWDMKVLEEMRYRLNGKRKDTVPTEWEVPPRLHEFWDAGIRGPDFVWAATGPALEAYSKYPIVKKANDAGKTMEVGEFLSHVRRMVVDFVVGRVLTGDGSGADLAASDRMDAPTAYYLLHRHDFGLEEAPSGACILYATACGLSDRDLESTWDILVRTGGESESLDSDEEEDDAEPDAEAEQDEALDSGSKLKLKIWAQRAQKSMGYEAPGGQPVPLIDRIHRLMHLWRDGDVLKVDEYLDEHALRRQELFRRLLQSLIELSRKDGASQELQILESLSNHVQAKGAMVGQGMLVLDGQS